MFRSWRQSVRELGERVERLEGELGRLNMENADLKSQLKERDARIAKLESVLEESRRAGKRQAAPFSKDKPKRDPKKPGRKPGSKYGRQAVRAIPVPDKTFEAPCPEQCPCGGKVGAEGSIDLYQVDIPPIQPETWKFVVGHGHCQECGRRVRGQHPLLISKAFEVGTVHFGPRLLAFAAFQKMICGVSYDKIRLGFEQMLGFPVARSTLCRAMQRLARRAKPTRDALVEALRASPVVYADETGWKQGGRRVWLWVFTNLRETVYEILPGRGFEQAASVLGKNYAGTLGVDGWAPYRCFKEATLQTCYNHLLHRCHELLETATRGAVRFPRLVKAILRHALALRDRRDAGEISPHGLRVAKGLLQAKMNRLLHGRFTNPANQRLRARKRSRCSFSRYRHPPLSLKTKSLSPFVGVRSAGSFRGDNSCSRSLCRAPRHSGLSSTILWRGTVQRRGSVEPPELARHSQSAESRGPSQSARNRSLRHEHQLFPWRYPLGRRQ